MLDLTVYESNFGQYRQDIIDNNSPLYRFEPDTIMIAAHEGAAELPNLSASPSDEIASEFERWAALWQMAGERTGARVIQHNFALKAHPPLGHLATRVPGSRYAMLQGLNARFAAGAPEFVSIVDCDRLSSVVGRDLWFDARYWHLAKQAVSLGVLPLLARHTIGVLAASLGLSRKCLAFDLDNTIWGGVVGEDGLNGITLGATPRGEAFCSLQDYLLQLRDRGVILAVVSKNNEQEAKEVFERHPEMRLRLDDIAVFIANWDDKPTNLRRVANELGLGLDALVFLDDNPGEREIVRQALPDVEVLVVPEEPVGILEVLSQSLLFEPASLTSEDRGRADQYRARAEAAKLQASAVDLDSFYRSLGMQAVVAPFDDTHLPRIVQLIGKTNQFNLTSRRHSTSMVESFVRDPNWVHLYLKLRDRFADHGLVALVIARRLGTVLDIDTFLMSCRVIGRTVERELMKHLSRKALDLGCSRLRGTYVPSAKNAVVRDLYRDLGFESTGGDPAGSTTWEYDLVSNGALSNDFILSEGTSGDR